VIPPDTYERYRKSIHGALFLVGQGTLEKTGKVTNIKVQRLEPIASL
jgi:error-prone DNA polymerase